MHLRQSQRFLHPEISPAPDSGPGGRRFKSSLPDQEKKRDISDFAHAKSHPVGASEGVAFRSGFVVRNLQKPREGNAFAPTLDLTLKVSQRSVAGIDLPAPSTPSPSAVYSHHLSRAIAQTSSCLTAGLGLRIPNLLPKLSQVLEKKEERHQVLAGVSDTGRHQQTSPYLF